MKYAGVTMVGWMQKIRMPPDTFERHALVARLAGSTESVLDVGGIKGELKAFLPDATITTINMEGENADEFFDGDRLPFPDDTFDVAVSLDVLEHIPVPGRDNHFVELCRVARRMVIVCCPLGTREHIDAEQAIADWYVEYTSKHHRFLEEHLENGLPTESELASLATSTSHPFRIMYHGDFRKANAAFASSVRLRRRPDPRHIANYLRFRLDPRRSFDIEESCTAFTNRAFVTIDLVDSTVIT